MRSVSPSVASFHFILQSSIMAGNVQLYLPGFPVHVRWYCAMLNVMTHTTWPSCIQRIIVLNFNNLYVPAFASPWYHKVPKMDMFNSGLIIEFQRTDASWGLRDLKSCISFIQVLSVTGHTWKTDYYGWSCTFPVHREKTMLPLVFHPSLMKLNRLESSEMHTQNHTCLEQRTSTRQKTQVWRLDGDGV